MSDITTTPSEINFDDWLATGAVTTRHVNLFSRLDLLAEIDELEAQLVKVEDYPMPEDESLGGKWEDPNKETNAKIDALWAEIDQSKRSFRVKALNSDKIQDLRRGILETFKDELDKEAAKGRAVARETAKRLEMSDPKEVNALVRESARNYVESFVAFELGVKLLAATTSTQNANGVWTPLSEENVRKLAEVVGDQQIGRLSYAANSANTDIPDVTPSK